LIECFGVLSFESFHSHSPSTNPGTLSLLTLQLASPPRPRGIFRVEPPDVRMARLLEVAKPLEHSSEVSRVRRVDGDVVEAAVSL
jgi:hypothetical protein